MKFLVMWMILLLAPTTSALAYTQPRCGAAPSTGVSKDKALEWHACRNPKLSATLKQMAKLERDKRTPKRPGLLH